MFIREDLLGLSSMLCGLLVNCQKKLLKHPTKGIMLGQIKMYQLILSFYFSHCHSIK